MRCVICKQGETAPGTATMTFDHAGSVVVIRHVPAKVCQACHEPYFEGDTTDRLLATARAAVRVGVQVLVQDYSEDSVGAPAAAPTPVG